MLYFDTDSVIYVSPTGQHLLPLGDFLGDLTDELNGGYITEFVSGGKPVLSLDKHILQVRNNIRTEPTLVKRR